MIICSSNKTPLKFECCLRPLQRFTLVVVVNNVHDYGDPRSDDLALLKRTNTIYRKKSLDKKEHQNQNTWRETSHQSHSPDETGLSVEDTPVKLKTRSCYCIIFESILVCVYIIVLSPVGERLPSSLSSLIKSQQVKRVRGKFNRMSGR